MVLEASLFNDLDEAVQRHIIHTVQLGPQDPNKFYLSTPALASLACRIVLEGASCSKQITQEIYKLANNLSFIEECQGYTVPGLGNSDHQCSSTDKSK